MTGVSVGAKPLFVPGHPPPPTLSNYTTHLQTKNTLHLKILP